MKIAVFDVDDTIIKHTNGSESYYTGRVNSNFKHLLKSKGYEKVYLYTNGTYGHAEEVLNNMKLNNIFNKDNFDSIEVKSAGQRDPDAEGAEGMSASKMRAAATEDDYNSFKNGLPSGFRGGEEMFNEE